MLSSYEAIYDHGRLIWIDEAPDPVRVRVIVTLVRGSADIGESLAANSSTGKEQGAIGHPRTPIEDDAIERIMRKTCGAWGSRSFEEVEAMIGQRRHEDWGDDEKPS